jgi:hypothetical protein
VTNTRPALTGISRQFKPPGLGKAFPQHLKYVVSAKDPRFSVIDESPQNQLALIDENSPYVQAAEA